MRAPVVIDFETSAILPRPNYPPQPVGVSIMYPGNKPKYLAWNHPAENNTTFSKAQEELSALWRSDSLLLFHNAAFDLEVAQAHMGLPIPSWERIHDTLYLLFLDDPHADTLSLKPAAERLLNMPPEEASAVRAWLIKAGIVRPTDKHWGAHISKAPGKLVGEYAMGDVLRTKRLFGLLHPRVVKAGMQGAYDRERQLMPILLRNEREGIRVDLPLLRSDNIAYGKALTYADDWLRKRLKSPSLNIDSNDELAHALDINGVVSVWVRTATGKKSTAKNNLTPSNFNDAQVASVLGYRNRLQTVLSTFIKPWLEMAEVNKGYIFTRWNQVRQAGERSYQGTRTGRLSCSPNFQNIPKNWDDKDDGYVHPVKLRLLPELPLARKYLLPDTGQVFLHRDYNQQELRILAHFEDDKLRAAYADNPRLDVHTYMQEEINRIAGLKLDRRPVKILNFGIMYGMGNGKLALKTGTDVNTAARMKAAQRAAIPGLRALEYAIRQRASQGFPVKTWGGRLYFTEPPKMINGEMRSFEYKLLNYLIQGSAADCTKEAIIRYDAARKHGRFLVTVHDEINICAPKEHYKQEMALLREAMESVEFDVPMITDGKFGPTWGDLTKYPEK